MSISLGLRELAGLGQYRKKASSCAVSVSFFVGAFCLDLVESRARRSYSLSQRFGSDGSKERLESFFTRRGA